MASYPMIEILKEFPNLKKNTKKMLRDIVAQGLPKYRRIKNIDDIFFRVCHGPFVWAWPRRANLEVSTGRAGPGQDF